MFTRPNLFDVVSDPGRKRTRDGEDDTSAIGFGEHRNKRIHCLPLRTSPRLPDPWQQHSAPNSGFSSQFSQQYDGLNMAEPSRHVEDVPQLADQGTGRLPTPMHPNFAVQVRGHQYEWAGPGPAFSNLNGIAHMNLGHPDVDHHSDAQLKPNMPAWQSVQNNRRIPSPISENDSLSSHGMISPDMMSDDGESVAMSPEITTAEPLQRTMDHPNAMMDIELSPAAHHHDEIEGSPPSSVRRGHVRSKHTINNWTWQPGMKKSFSVGYRADCEKCRLRVPGHFNHIIIS